MRDFSDYVIQQLANHASIIHGLVNGVSLEQALWKPGEDAWSMLEVMHISTTRSATIFGAASITCFFGLISRGQASIRSGG